MVAPSIVIGTVNNFHIEFKCGSINFYKQRKQTAKYQHLGITPLRFINLRNHLPEIKSCEKFPQLNKSIKLIQATLRLLSQLFWSVFLTKIDNLFWRFKSHWFQNLQKDLVRLDLKNCSFAVTRPWVWE